MKPTDELDALEDQAAEWVVRRDAGLTPEQQAEFEHWLAADPRHFAAFAEMEAALGALNRPRELGRSQEVARELVIWDVQKRRSRHDTGWKVAYSLLGAAAAIAVAAVLFWNFTRVGVVPAPSVATMTLRPELQKLPDGSVVELNANAEIAVDFTPGRRGVRLVRGEALFTVTKDPARPFVVTSGNVEVRAVGTAFVVRLDPANVVAARTELVEVLVTEGSVLVGQAAPLESASGAPALPPPPPVMVASGGRLAVPADGSMIIKPTVEPVTPLEMNTALAWREMRFEFTNTSLAEAVELFNRKSKVKLSLADPSLADLRVSGIYWADNADGFASLIESSLDIEAVREAEDRITLRRRR